MLARAVQTTFVPQPVAGIGLALVAFALFTCMDTAVKLLGGRYALPQVMFFNSLFAFTVNCAIIMSRGQLGQLRTRRLRLHLLRWAVSLGGGFAAFYAYTKLPLADVYAVLFASPLMITALSVPVLGERVGWRRWTAICVGFLGIVVMLRPGISSLNFLAGAALLGALGNALNLLMVRKLSQTEPPVSFGLYGNIFSMTALGCCLPFVWTTPSLGDLALNALAGGIAGGGFWLLASAFRHAPAAVVAPFQYSQMPYGVLSGWLLYRTVPDAWIMLGATIVIGSGLYVLQREAHLARHGRHGARRSASG